MTNHRFKFFYTKRLMVFIGLVAALYALFAENARPEVPIWEIAISTFSIVWILCLLSPLGGWLLEDPTDEG